jgi:hypothetical protein
MKELDKKLGPLKLWQWVAIGTAAGVAVYLYKKSSESATAKEVNPEEEEKLLGALDKAAGSGGGGEGSSGSNVAAPGPVGLTGEPGAPGPAGAAPETVNLAPIEASISNLEHQLATNNPPTVSHNTASQKKGVGEFTHVNPANGQHYKVVSEKGKTVHVYQNGHRVVVGSPKKATGAQQKPKAPKRPKPTPIHKRVTVHHVAPHKAAPKPVHHAAPVHRAAPKPARKRR